MTRSSAYLWRERDEDFRKAWDEAVEEGTDLLEDEAKRRAVEGSIKPILYKGRIVTFVREQSDTLLIFLLKARRKMYREGSSDDSTPDRLDELVRALKG
jgi:hypothetical protein